MTTIELTGSEAIGKIPIGRRILEVMHEKGNAFSIRAFADRLGINRETFRITLTGDRPISLSLVEKIAESLGVTEDRLRQLDTFKKEEELFSLLKSSNRTKVMLMRAHSIALELVEVAIGATERGFAYNYLGRVQFLLQQYEDAHRSWKQALEYGKKIQKTFNDSRLLKIVSANFMMACARLKDYGGADEMLQLVEEISTDDDTVLGIVAYSRMVMCSDRGNLEHARKYAYQSLEHFIKTNDNKQIGHGHINVARIEYLLGNYAVSAKILASALEIVHDFDYLLVRVVKDYVRSLMKLRDYDTATQIVEKYQSVTKQFPEYWNKMQIMYTVLKDDPKYADEISKDLHASVEARILACKCLFEYYAKRGDSESALRYYKLERKYSRDNSEFIDGEGF
jgi:tetratricopeptide (TPR) repeat protein